MSMVNVAVSLERSVLNLGTNLAVGLAERHSLKYETVNLLNTEDGVIFGIRQKIRSNCQTALMSRPMRPMD